MRHNVAQRKWSDEIGLRNGKRCPKCGAVEKCPGRVLEPLLIQGPVEGIVTCQKCQFMWGEGMPGRGIEWWNDMKGWIRAPEGCMRVEGEL